MILVGPPDVRLKGKLEENAVHDWTLQRTLSQQLITPLGETVSRLTFKVMNANPSKDLPM